MTLDEARALLAALTYKPGWILRSVDGPDGPTLVIVDPVGKTTYAPLPMAQLHRHTPRDLAYWAHGRLVEIEVRAARAAFRVGGRALDELEGS